MIAEPDIGPSRIKRMAAIAKSAIVVLTALPMLASPGWCCVALVGACGHSGARIGELANSGGSSTSSLPACCATRAKSQAELEHLVRMNEGHCPAVGFIESPTCSCCEGTRTVAVAAAAKQVRETSPIPTWIPALPSESSAVAPAPVDNGTLQSCRPSLQILQCVWRC